MVRKVEVPVLAGLAFVVSKRVNQCFVTGSPCSKEVVSSCTGCSGSGQRVMLLVLVLVLCIVCCVWLHVCCCRSI